MIQTRATKMYLAVGCILGWFAVGLQFYLIINNRVRPLLDTIIQFLSYFTILTNILVAMCFTVLLLKPRSVWGNFFLQAKVLTAITVYITVVGIVYNLILRNLWNPQGWQMMVDELLHTVNPVLFVLFWFIFVGKAELRWKQAFPWLIYPLIYSMYVFARGSTSGLYPYPFINVSDLGYQRVLFNTGILFIAFFVISLLFIGMGKLIILLSSKR